MALKQIPLVLAMVFFTTTITSLSSSPQLATSAISAAPAFLPYYPLPSPATSPVYSPPDIPSSPNLSPDITPLFPTPSQTGPSPAVMPTIPSTLSPPNPDATTEPGLNMADSPSPSTDLASSSPKPLDLAGLTVMLVMAIFCLVVLQQN